MILGIWAGLGLGVGIGLGLYFWDRNVVPGSTKYETKNKQKRLSAKSSKSGHAVTWSGACFQQLNMLNQN